MAFAVVYPYIPASIRMKLLHKKFEDKINKRVKQTDLHLNELIGCQTFVMDARTNLVYPRIWRFIPPTENYTPRLLQSLLLYGPQSTSEKAYVIEAMANELSYKYLRLEPADIEGESRNETILKICAAFKVAKEVGGCVVFIDDGDVLFAEGSEAERQLMYNEFIYFFDHLQEHNQSFPDLEVILVVAAKFPTRMDARIRAKFATGIHLPLPEECDRKDMIMAIFKKYRLNVEQATLDTLVSSTNGWNCTDFSHVHHVGHTISLSNFSQADIIKMFKHRPGVFDPNEQAAIASCEEWANRFQNATLANVAPAVEDSDTDDDVEESDGEVECNVV